MNLIYKLWKHLAMSHRVLSVTIPYYKIFHISSFHVIGKSIPTCFNGFAHYNWMGIPVGKTMPNIAGELIYYDAQGKLRGYCKRQHWNKLIHYDKRGSPIGCTYNVFGILCFHKFS